MYPNALRVGRATDRNSLANGRRRGVSPDIEQSHRKPELFLREQLHRGHASPDHRDFLR